MARNNYVRRHFLSTPWRMHTAHFSPNRAQRRADARGRDAAGKLVVEPSSNFTLRKVEEPCAAG